MIQYNPLTVPSGTYLLKTVSASKEDKSGQIFECSLLRSLLGSSHNHFQAKAQTHCCLVHFCSLNCEMFAKSRKVVTHFSWYIYNGVRRVSGLRKKPVVSVKNTTLIPTSIWERWSRPLQTPTLSVWGSSRRLQVPYVIPRPGVPRHMLAVEWIFTNKRSASMHF